MKLHVIRSEVRNASRRLTQALSDFTEASRDAHEAAETLYEKWEGDRQKDFVREEQKSQDILREMAKNVQNFIGALQEAETSYGEVDQECAQIFRNV